MKGVVEVVGGGKLFAAIAVTYPRGAECTAGNGTKTLRAKDSDGVYIFPIPEPGSWTVRAELGESTEKTLSITEKGQVESVALDFTPEVLLLFDGGDISSESGGWNYDGRETEPLVADELGLDIDSSISGAWVEESWVLATSNAIDMSGYSKLCANISCLDVQGEEDAAWLCVVDSIASNASLSAGQLIDSSGKVTVDISNVSSGHVGLKLQIISNGYGQFIGSVHASKIWLE